jgi:site-specific recombinase XerD
MNIQEALECYREHLRSTVKKRTQQGYNKLLARFESQFYDRHIESIKAEELCRFLETYAEGLSKSTRHLRYAQLKAFFNFIIDTY